MTSLNQVSVPTLGLTYVVPVTEEHCVVTFGNIFRVSCMYRPAVYVSNIEILTICIRVVIENAAGHNGRMVYIFG